MIPWRVRVFISKYFPLLYHYAANFGVQANSAEHWDKRLEETWDDPDRSWPAKNALLRDLIKPQMQVLDVACGNGSILRALKSAGVQNLFALEISAYAVARLRGEGIDARCGMLPDIDYEDVRFDAVIASQVLEHIIRRRTFLKEILRVLKPGGEAYIFVPDNRLGPIDEPEHVVMFNEKSLRKLLSRNFEVLAVESIRDAVHFTPVLYARIRKPITPPHKYGVID